MTFISSTIANRPTKYGTVPPACAKMSGVKEVSDRIWLVSFMDYDLGFFDHEIGRLGTAENPFAAKVLPMSPE